MRFSPASFKAGMPDFEFWAFGGYWSPTSKYEPTRHYWYVLWSFPKPRDTLKQCPKKEISGRMLIFYFLFFDYRELIKIFN